MTLETLADRSTTNNTKTTRKQQHKNNNTRRLGTGDGLYFTEKSKPRFWGNPTQKPRVKEIFVEHILRPIQNLVSSLPDHFGTGVKMTSKNIFFTLSFWVELPQILGLGFSA